MPRRPASVLATMLTCSIPQCLGAHCIIQADSQGHHNNDRLTQILALLHKLWPKSRVSMPNSLWIETWSWCQFLVNTTYRYCTIVMGRKRAISLHHWLHVYRDSSGFIFFFHLYLFCRRIFHMIEFHACQQVSFSEFYCFKDNRALVPHTYCVSVIFLGTLKTYPLCISVIFMWSQKFGDYTTSVISPKLMFQLQEDQLSARDRREHKDVIKYYKIWF